MIKTNLLICFLTLNALGQIPSTSREPDIRKTSEPIPADVRWIHVAPEAELKQNRQAPHQLDFWMMETEVTNAQYAAYLNAAFILQKVYLRDSVLYANYAGDRNWNAGDRQIYDLYDKDARISWNGFTFEVLAGFQNHPVVEVTWFGAWAYAAYNGFRLPTVKEWVLAARGETQSEFPWGINPQIVAWQIIMDVMPVLLRSDRLRVIAAMVWKTWPGMCGSGLTISGARPHLTGSSRVAVGWG